MGRPKVKVIDDSQPSAEVKTTKKEVQTKSESASPVIPILSEQSESKERNLPSSEDPSLIVQDDKKKELKKATKPGKAKPRSLPRAKPRGKKYQEIVKGLDRSKSYPLNEAVEMVKKLSYTKFDSTLEAHINTVQTGIRGLVSLPFASGRKLRIIAFGKGAENSGADLVGSEDTIEEINKGKVNFDIVVTTPEWMPKLAKIARILGPRGLMPNPKNSTIAEDLKKAVEGFQAGKTEYKTEAKAPVMHIALGKLNQPNEQLSANIKTLLQTIGKTKVKKVSLSPTMGPSVKLDLTSV